MRAYGASTEPVPTDHGDFGTGLGGLLLYISGKAPRENHAVTSTNQG